MKTISFPLRLALGAGLLASAITVSAQDVIYRENFAATVNSASPSSQFGWTSTGVYNNGSTLVANAPLVSAYSTVNTGPLATGINNSPIGGSDSTGVGFAAAFLSSGQTDAKMLATTTEYFGTTTIQVGTLDGFGIQTGSSGGATAVQVAVKIGGTWYVNSVTKAPGSAAAASNFTGTLAQSQSWNSTEVTGANWSDINTSTTAFSIGGTAANVTLTSIAGSSAAVEGVGFYYTWGGGSATQRFDNFFVTASAVPEPSTFAVIAGVFVLGVAALRRRRAV